jgi:hypothetical protein
MAHRPSVEAPDAAIVILPSPASCFLALSSLDTRYDSHKSPAPPLGA